jgi:hypothetical protein
MSTKTIKISIVVLIAITFFAAAQAAVNNQLLMPMILSLPTLTITPTITGTPYTPTPTRTITPTPTATLEPGWHILHVEHSPDFDELEEYVQIANATGKSVDMDDWILKNDHREPDIFTFPKFTLKSGGKVKVWTKAGDNTSRDLYWGRTEPVWNKGGDCAYLREKIDDDTEEVARYCYGD